METKQCQCEDSTHFEDGAPERLEQRYQAHVYGAVDVTTDVRTSFGTFAVCRECIQRGHMETGE